MKLLYELPFPSHSPLFEYSEVVGPCFGSTPFREVKPGQELSISCIAKFVFERAGMKHEAKLWEEHAEEIIIAWIKYDDSLREKNPNIRTGS